MQRSFPKFALNWKGPTTSSLSLGAGRLRPQPPLRVKFALVSPTLNVSAAVCEAWRSWIHSSSTVSRLQQTMSRLGRDAEAASVAAGEEAVASITLFKPEAPANTSYETWPTNTFASHKVVMALATGRRKTSPVMRSFPAPVALLPCR